MDCRGGEWHISGLLENTACHVVSEKRELLLSGGGMALFLGSLMLWALRLGSHTPSIPTFLFSHLFTLLKCESYTNVMKERGSPDSLPHPRRCRI